MTQEFIKYILSRRLLYGLIAQYKTNLRADVSYFPLSQRKVTLISLSNKGNMRRLHGFRPAITNLFNTNNIPYLSITNFKKVDLISNLKI